VTTPHTSTPTVAPATLPETLPATRPATPGADREKLSPWQERTIERNLIDAKRRLLSKSARFVEAARALLEETGGLDFTVQDVVERSRLSLRGFYQAFASKDDLLLALYEEGVAASADSLREIMRDAADPLEQIHAFLSLYWTSQQDRQVIRALMQFHLRATITRPDDIRHALEPVHAVLSQAVARGVDAGRIRSDVSPARLARLLMSMAITAIHSAEIDGTDDGTLALPDDVWTFCLQGMAVTDAAPSVPLARVPLPASAR
jgi:AcrR family transcriptional regulator